MCLLRTALIGIADRATYTKLLWKGWKRRRARRFDQAHVGAKICLNSHLKKNIFFTTSLQCVSKIETYHCRNFRRALTPICQRNPWRAELETLSLCYVWSPIITPTRYIGGLSKETAPPPPQTNERQCSGSFLSVSQRQCTVGLNGNNPPKIRFKNSWNWPIIIMPATSWQLFNKRRAQ